MLVLSISWSFEVRVLVAVAFVDATAPLMVGQSPLNAIFSALCSHGVTRIPHCSNHRRKRRTLYSAAVQAYSHALYYFCIPSPTDQAYPRWAVSLSLDLFFLSLESVHVLGGGVCVPKWY